MFLIGAVPRYASSREAPHVRDLWTINYTYYE